MYVTIDPGISTGWAIWSRAGLVDCGLGDPRSSPFHIIHSDNAPQTIQAVWIESPVIYPRSKARPADIVKLAKDAGRWAGIYSVLVVDVHFVEPAEWKGQIPKSVHHPRILATLNGNEREILALAGKGVPPSKRHNILDAVGLGLWVAKR